MTRIHTRYNINSFIPTPSFCTFEQCLCAMPLSVMLIASSSATLKMELIFITAVYGRKKKAPRHTFLESFGQTATIHSLTRLLYVDVGRGCYVTAPFPSHDRRLLQEALVREDEVAAALAEQDSLYDDPAFPASAGSLYRTPQQPPAGAMPPSLSVWARISRQEIKRCHSPATFSAGEESCIPRNKK